MRKAIMTVAYNHASEMHKSIMAVVHQASSRVT